MGFNEFYSADIARYGQSIGSDMRFFSFVFRKAQFSTGIVKKIYRFLLLRFCKRRGIKLSWRTKVGKGLYIGHPFAITVNEDAILGDNVNIHKGVTIGQQNRGTKQGVPVIGNQVWIGINAVVVGKIHIGNDVLIAPNAYVNFDVPDHSIVLGNPGVIISRNHATEGYINNTVNS